MASLAISHFTTRLLGKLDPTETFLKEQKKHPLSSKQAVLMSLPHVVVFAAYAMMRNRVRNIALVIANEIAQQVVVKLKERWGQK